jgi:hypothetical protein
MSTSHLSSIFLNRMHYYFILFLSGLTASQQIHILWNNSKQRLHDFNIFPSVPPSNDPIELSKQKISTRLFTLLLIFFITILLLYNSLVTVNKTITIEKPTIHQYSDLYSKYSKQLQCPCKKISNALEEFLQIDYTSHYTCTSFVTSEQWIDFLMSAKVAGGLYFNDFRLLSRYCFPLLRSFCQITQQVINNSLTSFNSNQYVSAYLTSSDLFRTENEERIRQFISSTTNKFLFSLKVNRDTAQGDALISGLLTNFYFYAWSTIGSVVTYTRNYDGCYCVRSASCFTPAIIRNASANGILFTVPGFYGGCYIVESLLRSTLECFHDEQCFLQLKYYVNSSLTINATILNASLSTQFPKTQLWEK